MAIDARPPAHVITVLNLKGGVGKTHSVWLLASVCQEGKKRILQIDLDTQGNLSGSFSERDRRPGVEALVDPSADATPALLVRRAAFNCIDIITASPALAPFDLSDQRVWERLARDDSTAILTRRHLFAASRLMPEEQEGFLAEVREHRLTATETERSAARRRPNRAQIVRLLYGAAVGDRDGVSVGSPAAGSAAAAPARRGSARRPVRSAAALPRDGLTRDCSPRRTQTRPGIRERTA